MKVLRVNNTPFDEERICFFSGVKVKYNSNYKYRYETDNGWLVSYAEGKKRTAEMSPSYQFPAFFTREEIGKYLREDLDMRNSDPEYRSLYSRLGDGLDPARNIKAEHPGARVPEALRKEEKPQRVTIGTNTDAEGRETGRIVSNVDGSRSVYNYPYNGYDQEGNALFAWNDDQKAYLKK